jgi:hypothetical protein
MQVWYADDAGSVANLRPWWDELARLGPSYGYFTNPSKTWLVSKEACLSDAISAFEGTNVNVTCKGRPYLGAPLGSSDYINTFVSEKVDQWSGELKFLSAIATTQPHASFVAFSHGLTSKWSFLSWTTPHISHHFSTLENIIRSNFIPTLTGEPPPNDLNRALFALPARLGGLGISNPMTVSDIEFDVFRKICEPLAELALERCHDYPYVIDNVRRPRAV